MRTKTALGMLIAQAMQNFRARETQVFEQIARVLGQAAAMRVHGKRRQQRNRCEANDSNPAQSKVVSLTPAYRIHNLVRMKLGACMRTIATSIVALTSPMLVVAQWPAPKAPVVPEADGFITIPKAAVPPDRGRVYKAIFDATRAADKPAGLLPALNNGRF